MHDASFCGTLFCVRRGDATARRLGHGVCQTSKKFRKLVEKFCRKGQDLEWAISYETHSTNELKVCVTASFDPL